MELQTKTTAPYKQSNVDDNADAEGTTLEQLGGILCNVCDGIFDNKKDINQHFKTKHAGQTVYYTCILCSKVFIKYKTFHDHCYRHVSGKRFWCEKCKKQLYVESYRLHMETFHINDNKTQNPNEPRQYDCKQCSKKYNNFRDLAQHLRYCKTDNNHTCHICNKQFTEKSFLLRHLPFHSEVRDFKCQQCDGSFKTKRSLAVHTALQHENNLNFECPICLKRFATSTKLKFHTNSHLGHRPYRCDYCEMTFTNTPNRIKHMHRQHSEQCQHRKVTLLETIHLATDSPDKPEASCRDKGDDNITLRGTLRINGNQQLYVCVACKMQFTERRSWLRHMKRNHLNYKYKCDQCNKVIIVPKPIEAYPGIPTNDSTKPFICDYCDSGFTDKGNLERHIIRAKHIKCNHRCTICNTAFFSSIQLRSHVKKHQKQDRTITSTIQLIKPKNNTTGKLGCEHCDKCFNRLSSRLRHMKRKHHREFEKYIRERDRIRKIKKTEEDKLFEMYSFPSQYTTNENPRMDGINKANVQKIDSVTVNERSNKLSHNITINVNVKTPDKPNYSIANTAMPQVLPYPVAGMQPYIVLVPNRLEPMANPLPLIPNQMITNNAAYAPPPLPNLNNAVVTENKMPRPKPEDDIDDLLNYVDTLIRDNNELDILKETIDFPESPEESNLDILTTDFPPELPGDIVQDFGYRKQNVSNLQPTNHLSPQNNNEMLNISQNFAPVHVQHPLESGNILNNVPFTGVPAPSNLREYAPDVLIDNTQRPQPSYLGTRLPHRYYEQSIVNPTHTSSNVMNQGNDSLVHIDPRLTTNESSYTQQNVHLPNVDTNVDSDMELISSIIKLDTQNKQIVSPNTEYDGECVNSRELAFFENILASYNTNTFPTRSSEIVWNVPSSDNTNTHVVDYMQAKEDKYYNNNYIQEIGEKHYNNDLISLMCAPVGNDPLMPSDQECTTTSTIIGDRNPNIWNRWMSTLQA